MAIGISETVVAARGLDAGKIIKEQVAPLIKGGGGESGLGPDQQRDERGYLIEPEERSGGGWGGGVDGGNFGL